MVADKQEIAVENTAVFVIYVDIFLITMIELTHFLFENYCFKQ